MDIGRSGNSSNARLEVNNRRRASVSQLCAIETVTLTPGNVLMTLTFLELLTHEPTTAPPHDVLLEIRGQSVMHGSNNY